MKRKPIPQKVRRRVYEKYGGRCAYCGQPIAYTCNHYKHTLTIEQFREEIGRLTARLRERSYIYRLALRHGCIKGSRKPVRFYFEREAER